MRRRGGRTRQRAEEAEPAQVEVAAVRLLARREHSAFELRAKLVGRGYPEPRVDAVLADLARRRLLSDARFAEVFVNAHVGRGEGPVKIRAELARRGVAEELIEQALAAAGVDWHRLAAEVRGRRFGPAEPREYRERVRQAQFLQRRGFAMEHIRAALKGDIDDM